MYTLLQLRLEDEKKKKKTTGIVQFFICGKKYGKKENHHLSVQIYI